MLVKYEPTARLIEEQLGQPVDDPDLLRRTAIQALRALDQMGERLEAAMSEPQEYDDPLGWQMAVEIAVRYILGGGLDSRGKTLWLNTHGDMTPVELVHAAIAASEPMIAT